MPYSAQHLLFAWTGHFYNSGGEVLDDFAGSLRFMGPGVNDNENEEVLNALATTMLNYVADQRSGIPSNATFDNFKWNKIGTDGRYVAKNQTLMTEGTPQGGGVMTARYPSQVACATTWTTDFRRGRASKGRTFWPTAHEVSSSTRLRLPAAVALAMAEWSVELIAALNSAASTGTPVAAPWPGATPPPESNALAAAVMSDLGSGTSALIKGANVGDRLDIQRRRGGRLAEQYQTSSFDDL